jgi:hypothetical protein
MLFAQEISLENNQGVKIIFTKTDDGYAFGSIYLKGLQVEKALTQGILSFRNIKNDQVVWLHADKAEKQSETKAVLTGRGRVNGVSTSFRITIETPQHIKAVNITYDFSVDKDINDYQAC